MKVKIFGRFRGICFLHHLQNIHSMIYLFSELPRKMFDSEEDEIIGHWRENCERQSFMIFYSSPDQIKRNVNWGFWRNGFSWLNIRSNGGLLLKWVI
jgi:hypothetical protein